MPASPATTTLSESQSKALLAPYGVPVLDERVVATPSDAADAAVEIGLPVVVKLCGDRIAHKTERGLVRLGLGDAPAVAQAATELLAAATPEDGDVGVLVAPMVAGNRELIAGMHRDPQFGPTVMLGVGGIFAEALADVAIALVPVGDVDAEDLIDALATQRILGAFRGEPAVDRAAVVGVVTALSRVAEEHPEVQSIDLNPLIISEGRPIAVDALVEVNA